MAEQHSSPPDRVNEGEMTHIEAPGQVARDPVKFGLGIFTAFIAGTLALAAVVFVWLGFFPSLVLMMICIPLSALAARLIRKGRPHNMA